MRGSQWKTPEEEARIAAEKEIRHNKMVALADFKKEVHNMRKRTEEVEDAPIPPSELTPQNVKDYIIDLCEYGGAGIYPKLKDLIETLPYKIYKAACDFGLTDDEECNYAIRRRLKIQASDWRERLTDPECNAAGLKYLIQAFAMDSEDIGKVTPSYKGAKNVNDGKSIEINIVGDE